MRKLAIFDWSGTLSDDRIPVYEAGIQMLKHFERPHDISFDEFYANASLGAVEFLRDHGVEGDTDFLFDHYKKTLKEVLQTGAGPTAYGHTKSFLEHLKNHDYTVAIVSSHPQENLEQESKDYGVDHLLDHIHGNSHNKIASLQTVMHYFNESPENSSYTGDMTHDILAAKGAGTLAIAVTTGYHGKEKLADTRPDFIFSSLEELQSTLYPTSS